MFHKALLSLSDGVDYEVNRGCSLGVGGIEVGCTTTNFTTETCYCDYDHCNYQSKSEDYRYYPSKISQYFIVRICLVDDGLDEPSGICDLIRAVTHVSVVFFWL